MEEGKGEKGKGKSMLTRRILLGSACAVCEQVTWVSSIFIAVVCSASADFAVSKEPEQASLVVAVCEVQFVFRRISPPAYKIDYPEFYLLETEVTNRMFREYLRATKKHKDDMEVLKTVKERRAANSFSTGDVPYSIDDEAMIWRDGEYPRGLKDHPATLITLEDATGFCEWLSKTASDEGLFRLPTWNEWMIAAYGNDRGYPWGDKWDRSLAHTSYGYLYKERKIRTEPVKDRPRGRTPEGLYGMLGNVSEYILDGDPTSKEYFNLGARWMGGGFNDGLSFHKEPTELRPRQDYWGYSHHSTMQCDDLGFRVLLDVRKDKSMVTRPRLFEQKNNAWRTKAE